MKLSNELKELFDKEFKEGEFIDAAHKRLHDDKLKNHKRLDKLQFDREIKRLMEEF